jgi:predicted cupin superfamily sugar epimerase
VNKPTFEELIKKLELAKHPEGGWYRETYRSEEVIQGNALPERFAGGRSFSTAIYFFLQSGDISVLHRIKSDEIWHFYSGAPLTVHVITPKGEYYPLMLGTNVTDGETFQCVVPAGCWFGAEVSGDGYSLVGCTVAPGFDFVDFEMGRRDALLKQFPEQTDIILRLTKIPHEVIHQEQTTSNTTR